MNSRAQMYADKILISIIALNLRTKLAPLELTHAKQSREINANLLANVLLRSKPPAAAHIHALPVRSAVYWER